jgi:hypothetical protein
MGLKRLWGEAQPPHSMVTIHRVIPSLSLPGRASATLGSEDVVVKSPYCGS